METNLEEQLRLEIKRLQIQINKQEVYLRRLHGQITSTPSVTGRIRKELENGTGNLVGTANRITVSNGTGSVLSADDVVLNLPQDIHTGASPTFAGLTLTGLAGILFATAGAISDAVNLPAYATNADAVGGGLAVGDCYRTGGDPDTICVVH